jgi:Asp-tRNA(Asn)/Glu-tRNA(Gln) amidotransferase A subunit family amidase
MSTPDVTPQPPPESPSLATGRRRFLALCTAAGLGQTLLPGALLAMAQAPAGSSATAGSAPQATPGPGAAVPLADLPKITPEMLEAAANVAGIRLTPEQRQTILQSVTGQRQTAVRLRQVHLENAVAPADIFNPVPAGMKLDTVKKPMRISKAPDVSKLAAAAKGSSSGPVSEELCFATVRELAELLRTRKITSLGLTQMYIARLRRYDPLLKFVITITEDRALAQARQADKEIAAGKYRGPLHGIPWGGKDLLAVKGYPTTWGAGGFESQSFDYDAEVVKRLDAAGAVLIAKLTMGSLAQGDVWFGGRTRNPWNPKQGSSGSSAGPASATAAGCVGFSIGTETQGSISSPSTRCGCSGLRPSFGLVPRTGAMALSWSMDKIGPITRSVEDCAIVLSAIAGPDGQDRSVQPAAFNWDADFDWRTLRVGYIPGSFTMPVPRPQTTTETTRPGSAGVPGVPGTAGSTGAGGAGAAGRGGRGGGGGAEARARQEYELKYASATLDVLRGMGVQLKPVELPDADFNLMGGILDAEAAASFQDLTLSGRDALLTEQGPGAWPNTFRAARFQSAPDYIQAMRLRTISCEKMAALFREVDVVVTTSGGQQIAATNLTGTPAVIIPNGIRGDDAPASPSTADGAGNNAGGPGTPVSITFLGGLYTEARLAAFARAYQEKTGFQKLHPKLG